MSVFASWLASPPPDAAIEIAPAAVSIAVVGSSESRPVVQGYALEPLAPGAVVPSLTTANVADRRLVTDALRKAVDRLGVRPKRVALVLPDLAVKVSLVRFDRVPSRREDLEQLIRWQVRKSAPFPVEDAELTFTPGVRQGAGGEFLVVLARTEVVRDYESVCEAAGMHPGLVDVATLSVINLFLSAGPEPAGDWLVIHMRPEYTSLAILRGTDVIFFRNRPESEGETLIDLVHQTVMYYQDRLSGQGFSRVLLGGTGAMPGAVDAARRSLEERLGLTVAAIDPTQAAELTDASGRMPELRAALTPLVGILLRARREAVGV